MVTKSVSIVTLQQREDYRNWAAEATRNGWAPGYASVRFKQKYHHWPSKQLIESATGGPAAGSAG